MCVPIIRFTRCCSRFIFIVCMLFVVPANAANTLTLLPATFNETVSVGSEPDGQALGQDLNLPENVFADYQVSGTLADGTDYAFSGQGSSLTTGGNIPAADVQGSSQMSANFAGNTNPVGAGLPVRVTAGVQYAVSIQPKAGATLPSGQFYFDVPITIAALGSVSWSGNALDAEWVNGFASSTVNVNGQKASAITGYGGPCANILGCTQNSAGDSFDFVFNETITWNAFSSFAGSVPISLSAVVDFRPTLASHFTPGNRIDSNTVSVQAIADPVLGFANPADAQLFEFIVSPGIAVVPIPLAAVLFGSGLLTLFGVAFRRKHPG